MLDLIQKAEQVKDVYFIIHSFVWLIYISIKDLLNATTFTVTITVADLTRSKQP